MLGSSTIHRSSLISRSFVAEMMLLQSPSLRDSSCDYSRDRSLTSPMLSHTAPAEPRGRPLEDLTEEVVKLFSMSLTTQELLSMSSKMRRQYKANLKDSDQCMLPSYNHTLPTGQEIGTYLAIDVGGSTFRVALVELGGNMEEPRITRMSVSTIDDTVRRLKGTSFFDWMAEKMEAMLAESSTTDIHTRPIPVGLAWSFPIEQTSPRGGKIQQVGKGFSCAQGTMGQDLGDTIVAACRRRGLQIQMDAIINDSSATLLSRAYSTPSTSMSLILGTGTNAAVYLPISCIGAIKLSQRTPEWHAKAEKVIINTELSMFGQHILHTNRWDEQLNQMHQYPNFQPLEYLTTGRYLGEILRLIILEAVETAHLFEGRLPSALQEPYTLHTTALSTIEADTSPDLCQSATYLKHQWTMSSEPSLADLSFLRTTVETISARAAAYLAVAIHALWTLQKETSINPTTPFGTPRTSIACTGSVINKYPGFRTRCEGYIEQMTAAMFPTLGHFKPEKIALVPADDAGVIGAAVAVALAQSA